MKRRPISILLFIILILALTLSLASAVFAGTEAESAVPPNTPYQEQAPSTAIETILKIAALFIVVIALAVLAVRVLIRVFKRK